MAADPAAAHQRLRDALERATREVDAAAGQELDRERFQTLREAIRDVNGAAKEYAQAALSQSGRGRGLLGRLGRR
jgi:hypothetical protein